MSTRPNLLIICARNKRRSRTAEFIYKNDARFNIRSRGLSAQSLIKVSAKDCAWADHILLMETSHKTRLKSDFRTLTLPLIDVLDIPDDYEFMDPELISILTAKIEAIVAQRDISHLEL